MAARAAIFLNSRSGTAPEPHLLESAIRAAGFPADIHNISCDAGLSAWVLNVGRPYEILVAAGGDGTASTVAAAALQTRKLFGVIPAGTANHFARDAGVPRNIEEAVAVLAAGHSQQIDVSEVNGLIFLNNASIGAYPRLLWERRRARRRGLPRSLALSVAALRTWVQLRTLPVRLCVDGEEHVRRTPFVFIGNGEYEVEGLQVGRRPSIMDGWLSLYVAPEIGRLDSLTLPIRALTRTLKNHQKFEAYRASSISVELQRERVSVALDGEARLLLSPLRFLIRHRALPTLLPPAQEG